MKHKILTILFLLSILSFNVLAAEVETGYTHRYELENNLLDTNGTFNLSGGTIVYDATDQKQGIYSGNFSNGAANTGTYGLSSGNVGRSLSVWAKHDNIANGEYLGGSGYPGSGSLNAMFLSHGSATSMTFIAIANDHTFTTSTRSSGVWYHYVLTYHTNKSTELYVDGVIQESAVLTSAQSFPTTVIRIGESHAAGADFNGLIDDVRWYNFALTETQVQNIYDNPNGTADAIYIDNSTYNVTSGVNLGNQTIWRTNQSATATINDYTPTVIFDTNTASICAITDTDENLSTAMSNNGTLCNENSANATTVTHTCTTGWVMDSENNSLYIACGTEDSGYVDIGANSDSGELKVFVKLYTIIGTVLDELSTAINGAYVYIKRTNYNTTLDFTTSNSTGGYTFDVEDTGIYVVDSYDPTNYSQKPDAQLVNVTG